MNNQFIVKRDYKKWMGVKSQINNKPKYRSFHEGQIWWCNVGENVGTEINGKGSFYLRPVYILKKHNKLNFAGIPLTTKTHEGYGYMENLWVI